jgi:hypothetical protein
MNLLVSPLAAVDAVGSMMNVPPARLTVSFFRAPVSVRLPVTSEPVPTALSRKVPPGLMVKIVFLPITFRWFRRLKLYRASEQVGKEKQPAQSLKMYEMS